MDKKLKINALDYIAYAGAALVMIMPQYLLSSFLSAYYTDVALVSAGAVGTIVLVMRFTDGISDLLMGRIIDRTNTRFGKARPWILAGTIGLAATLFLVFHVPAGAGTAGKIAWLAITYFFIMTVFGTMEGVASSSMMIYMTDDTKQRNTFGASSMAGTYIGGVIATTVTSVLLTVWGYTQAGYDKTMILYAVVVLLCGIFAFFKLRERTGNSAGEGKKDSVPFSKVLFCIAHNKYYIFAVVAGLLINLINGITTGLGVYFCRDLFGDASKYTIVTIALLFPTLVGIPFAVQMAKKLGHHKTLVYGRIAYTIGIAGEAAALLMGNFSIFIICVVWCGICSSTFAACFQARVANICDYNQYKFKVDASGTLMSATSFCNKVGLGLGSAVTGIILELAHYDGSLAAAGLAQTAYTVSFERYSVALIPLILNIIVTVCLNYCNVDPEMEEVRAGLAEE